MMLPHFVAKTKVKTPCAKTAKIVATAIWGRLAKRLVFELDSFSSIM
jgi:hypothetical protein